jgi:cytochrome b561
MWFICLLVLCCFVSGEIITYAPGDQTRISGVQSHFWLGFVLTVSGLVVDQVTCSVYDNALKCF